MTLNIAQHFHRDGAVGARRAHNPEVVGSSPTSGIRHATDVKQSNTFTGVAERKRAWLTNHETYDRNVSPVYFNSFAFRSTPS